MHVTLAEVLNAVGIHSARELASCLAGWLVCAVFAAALFRTLTPHD